MSCDLEQGIEFRELRVEALEVGMSAAPGEVKGDIHYLGISEREVTFDTVIDGDSTVTLSMYGLHVAVKLLAQSKEFFASLLKVLTEVSVGYIKCLLQLLQEVCLGNFVGVELQTEWIEADFGETLLNHAEGRHLLSNEEYALAFIEGIGNHIGDGLRLSSTRRAIEDETLGLPTLNDRFEL